MIRLFAALDIPDDVATQLLALQTGLQDVRWSSRENLHVTLRYMGNLKEPMAGEVDHALARLKAKPFMVRLTELGSFGDTHRAHTLWAGVEKSQALLNLQTKIENAVQALGLDPDKRKYAPHITLGRLGHGTPEDAAAWIASKGQLAPLEFEVTRMVLYSSHRREKGSIYTPERYYIF